MMLTRINCDKSFEIGKIKPMHSVGQPPLIGIDTQHFHYLKEANIPYSRLHDVAGWFGGNMFVDIPNIFRDFSADVDDPASYDFVFTDILLSALIENGCEPYFRLGVSIENFHQIKSYRIFPPTDNEKWAKICEHIIRHYNEGWANGFHYNIKYWEIWNEPDGSYLVEENAMWKGTPEQYFDLYRVTSKHLKKCFGDTIKVGGYASCGFYAVFNDKVSGAVAMGGSEGLGYWEQRIIFFMDFFEKFIKIVIDEKLPFDFFSYHSYASVEDTLKMQAYVEKRFNEVGLAPEIHLNEWNPSPREATIGRSEPCANTVAMMCAMQNTKMQVMCYYDAKMRVSLYAGLFNPMTRKPYCTYYGFKAFGKLYKLGTQTKADSDNPAVYAVMATDGKESGLLISNIGECTQVTCNFKGDVQAYLIDENNMMTAVSIDPQGFTLEKNQVVYFEGVLE